jgi:putative ATPase
MMRMLEAGEDPLFVARRMIVFASEDIGNADAQALVVANAADQAYRRLGMPEGIYPLSHAALYLATAPKSRAVSDAWQSAKAAIDEHGALPVPLGLRNPVTKLMRDEGYGGGVKPGESCLPERLSGTKFWEP